LSHDGVVFVVVSRRIGGREMLHFIAIVFLLLALGYLGG
jgi:hypothetical protein